jgi:hypothetical protein
MIEITSKTLPNGYKVVVTYDYDPESPRTWDNLGKVVLSNRSRYSFGDETASPDYIKELEADKELICLPIYIYDHSGITINTTGFSCMWDSGQIGVIYCTKKDAVKEFGKKVCTQEVRDKALKCLQGEISDLNAYVSGEVYGYRVLDPDGEEVTSCWGYYGDVDDCLSAGVEEAEAVSKLRELRLQHIAEESDS